MAGSDTRKAAAEAVAGTGRDVDAVALLLQPLHQVDKAVLNIAADIVGANPVLGHGAATGTVEHDIGMMIER